MQFLFETLETVVVFADGSDICLKDDVLRRGGTDHLREPSQVGRAPIGPSCVADIVSEQKGFETELGVFQIAEGIFTRPRQVANGFIFSFGDIDRGEIARAGQPGELHCISAVSLDPITGFFGDQ